MNHTPQYLYSCIVSSSLNLSQPSNSLWTNRIQQSGATWLPSVQFSSVQSLSCVRLFPTPWTGALRLPCPSPTPRACSNSCVLSWWCHPNHLILHYPLLLLSSVFPRIRVFSNESVLCIRWPKYWSFNISPSNEYSGLISFRVGWLDLLAVQGTLKSLLQLHGSKASIRRHSAFFIVQLSHPHMTTGKTIALTSWIFVSNWMPLTSIARTQNTCSFCLSLLDMPPGGSQSPWKKSDYSELDVLWESLSWPYTEVLWRQDHDWSSLSHFNHSSWDAK